MAKILNGRIKIKHDTTANWNKAINFIPLAGEIIVYDDYKQIVEDGVTKNVPGIKVGDGLAYVVDLPFTTQQTDNVLMSHINNTDIHINNVERVIWNNKVACFINPEDEENVVFVTDIN